MNGIKHDRIKQFVKTWDVWALTGCMTAACSMHARNIHSDIFVFSYSDWRTSGDHPRSDENIFVTLEHEHGLCIDLSSELWWDKLGAGDGTAERLGAVLGWIVYLFKLASGQSQFARHLGIGVFTRPGPRWWLMPVFSFLGPIASNKWVCAVVGCKKSHLTESFRNKHYNIIDYETILPEVWWLLPRLCILLLWRHHHCYIQSIGWVVSNVTFILYFGLENGCW